MTKLKLKVWAIMLTMATDYFRNKNVKSEYPSYIIEVTEEINDKLKELD